MGLVLDSSVLIAAEREKRPVSQLLAPLSAEHSETEFLLSFISVMELEHGWHRANTPEAAAERRRYLDEVLAILPVEPFTSEMGVLAAKIDADMKKVGLVVATADRLIGITALHLDYAIGTRNVRHFKMIPGLKVLPLYPPLASSFPAPYSRGTGASGSAQNALPGGDAHRGHPASNRAHARSPKFASGPRHF